VVFWDPRHGEVRLGRDLPQLLSQSEYEMMGALPPPSSHPRRYFAPSDCAGQGMARRGQVRRSQAQCDSSPNSRSAQRGQEKTTSGGSSSPSAGSKRRIATPRSRVSATRSALTGA
jgi:hypothetical protein